MLVSFMSDAFSGEWPERVAGGRRVGTTGAAAIEYGCFPSSHLSFSG
jgi:hypothetical protein